MGLIHILTKLTYVFKTTKVSSANLNDIQDAVVELQDQWADPAEVGDVSELETTATEIVGAINEVLDDVKHGFANNLIPYPYYSGTTVQNGITWTNNSDGTITANGTATADTYHWCVARIESDFTLPIGSYTMSGSPSGGRITTYGMRANRTVGSSAVTYADDYGSGTTFTVTDSTATTGIGCFVKIGTTVNNLVFKPMLEKGTVAHDYVPYNDSMGGVRRTITAVNDNTADAYSSSSTYKVGQLCIYENTLYRCNTAITTAEAWTAAHWTATTIATEIENRVLWLPGVTVSATTGSIVSVSDSRITTDHVLASCTWASDSSITALTSWSTETAGQLTITGTCSAATTADILLVKKNN